METTLAARYARALADVVREPAAVEKTADELDAVAGLLGASRPLREFLRNPAFPASRKQGALGAILKKTRASAPASRLMQILLSRGRIEMLPQVAAEFRRIEERRLNRVSVEVTTAVVMDDRAARRMREALEKFTGKSVRLVPKVDPKVLGGARARIGSVLYDGTVAARLLRMRQRLIEER
jgi:F-type H+-transporting ATPase subunit delta